MKQTVIKILIASVIILGIAFTVVGKMWISEKKERIRHELNESELTKNIEQVNMVLNLERKDFEKMKTKWSIKIDSLISANNIALKSVKEVTILQTQYKDTGTVKIVYKEPQKQPDSGYVLPIEYDNGCWGIKGEIHTSDINSKLEITERTANNSSQLLVLRKRFLGFLWYRNKTSEYKAFSDCGEVQFNQINFVEK